MKRQGIKKVSGNPESDTYERSLTLKVIGFNQNSKNGFTRHNRHVYNLIPSRLTQIVNQVLRNECYPYYMAFICTTDGFGNLLKKRKEPLTKLLSCIFKEVLYYISCDFIF